MLEIKDKWGGLMFVEVDDGCLRFNIEDGNDDASIILNKKQTTELVRVINCNKDLIQDFDNEQ